MIFSSPIFLLLFLPLSLITYLICPQKLRNFHLLLFSLIFYAFGEGMMVLFILSWTLINYLLGVIISKSKKRLWLILAIGLNLGVLIYYKYLLFFLNPFSTPQTTPYLPLAISFFTIHAISYNIDIFQRKSKAEKSFPNFSLYMLLFPHLLAGPIIRYHQIQDNLKKKYRLINLDNFSEGVTRFITGLGKKVLIADTLALVVDEIFAIPPQHLSTPEAWLGALAFSLQIYFDFSGYSDMAIGIAQIFGFKFPENFNYPYISTSIREFWTRWHITLSSWLRDYVYIPLVRSGGKISKLKLHLSMLITFLLIGLWHGANWTYILFGAIQGVTIILETINNGALLKWMPKIVKHFYFFLVIVISWVFFRSETLDYALKFLSLMFGLTTPEIVYRQFEFFLRNDILLALVLGLLISLKLPQLIFQKISSFQPKLLNLQYLWFIGVLLLSVIVVASQTFQSFIYFRF
jgi:alginate O-acetyltransferase complex protein AlgI